MGQKSNGECQMDFLVRVKHFRDESRGSEMMT